MSLIDDAAAAIRPADAALVARTASRLDRLTKPPGSLGVLESLAIQVVATTGRDRPAFTQQTVFCFAADHGVAADGVSAYPQAVTAQMVLNFLAGGAAINVLARQANARIVVADLGVAADLPAHPALVRASIGRGTANFRTGPAMSPEQARAGVEAGIRIARDAIAHGTDLAATGEMGIGNTTSASAIVAAVTGLDPADVTGYGTGIDEERRLRKAQVIREALAVNRPDGTNGLDLLAKVGGFEIGGLAGVMLACAAARVPVVVDGFISTAAAVIACGIAPALKDHLIAAHRSAERGHQAALAHLGLAPLLALNLRLGEGTGAVLAMHLVDAGCRILNEMATFESAGISDKTPPVPDAAA